MADLELKHHVSEIPRGEAVPTPYQRHVTAQVQPDTGLSEAIMKNAESSNWMSFIGSAVASKASAAFATKLGTELGKNPEGEMGPSFTDFDKNLNASYAAQAQSTLSIQAQKLISQSNLEVAKSPRVDAAMISKSQQNIAQGLNKIYSLAPDSVRQNLESHYTGVMLSQNQALVNRMIGEQKEDRVDTLNLSNKLSAQNVHSLAMDGIQLDKNGDSIPALAALKATEHSVRAAAAIHDITQSEADTRIATARQSYLSGKYSREATKAVREGKLPEFMKNFVDKPPADVSDTDHPAVIHNVNATIQEQTTFRNQAETLVEAKFNLDMVTDLAHADPQAAMSQLSPIKATNLLIKYNEAINKANKDGFNLAIATENYQKPEVFSQLSEKTKTQVLNNKTTQYIQEQEKVGNNISVPEAQMHIAAIAGTAIPSYIAGLNAKAESANPIALQEADAAVAFINDTKPANLKGLSDQAKTMLAMFNSYKDSHDLVTAAQMAKEVVYNKDEEVRKAAEKDWADHTKKRKSSGQSDYSFALSVAGIDRDSLVDVPFLSDFVNNKYKGYYILSHGNEDIATRLTKADIDSTFGYTTINGTKQFTHLPLNKTYGFPDSANGLIHEDVRGQVEEQFKSSKALYDKGASDFYWMTEQQPSFEHVKQMMIDVKKPFVPSNKGPVENRKEKIQYENDIEHKNNAIERFRNGPPPKVIQHFRDGSSHEYELNIQAGVSIGRNRQGAMVGSYDVNLKQGNTITSIAQADPEAGHFKYTPNSNKIMRQYRDLFPVIVDPYQKEKITSMLERLGH